jgi:AcrR family transcriptional regulator
MENKSRVATRKYQGILDAATDLFLEHGYQEASISKLLSRFGGSRETIYRHFRSKEELFAAVLDHQLQDYLEFMLALDIQSDDLKQGLREWSNALMGIVTSERYIRLRRLVISEVTNRPVLGQIYYEHTYMKGTTAITGFLRRQQQNGRLKSINCERMTSYLVGMMLYEIMHKRIMNIVPAPTKEQICMHTEEVLDDFISLFGINKI